MKRRFPHARRRDAAAPERRPPAAPNDEETRTGATFLPKNVVLAALGTLLMAFLSNFLVWEMQKRQWKRDEAVSCLDEVSQSISDRLCKATKAYWAAEYDTDNKTTWDKYQSAIDDYNTTKEKIYLKIKKLVDKKIAEQFYNNKEERTSYRQRDEDFDDPPSSGNNTCLHRKMLDAHLLLNCYHQCKTRVNTKKIQNTNANCTCSKNTWGKSDTLFEFKGEKYSPEDVRKELQRAKISAHKYLEQLNEVIYKEIFPEQSYNPLPVGYTQD